jgi:hypothetical protein
MVLAMVFVSLSDWLHWCHSHDVDTVLAILAILFATIQFVDSRIQEHGLKKLAKSMSTRFVGNFPLNMSEIVDVVANTDDKLDIMCDVAAYGHYSQPVLFANYRRHIQDKRDAGHVVRLVIYTTDMYENVFRDQFPTLKFEHEQGTDRFKTFFRNNRHLRAPASYDDFVKIIHEEQTTILRVFQNSGVKIKTTTNSRLLSIWLEDEEDAVFGFQNPIDPLKEVSFRTRDGNLIKVMHEIFEEAWKNGVDMPAV